MLFGTPSSQVSLGLPIPLTLLSSYATTFIFTPLILFACHLYLLFSFTPTQQFSLPPQRHCPSLNILVVFPNLHHTPPISSVLSPKLQNSFTYIHTIPYFNCHFRLHFHFKLHTQRLSLSSSFCDFS